MILLTETDRTYDFELVDGSNVFIIKNNYSPTSGHEYQGVYTSGSIYGNYAYPGEPIAGFANYETALKDNRLKFRIEALGSDHPEIFMLQSMSQNYFTLYMYVHSDAEGSQFKIGGDYTQALTNPMYQFKISPA